MIDWPTDLPAGAKAHIFWPAASSKDVIFLSARLFGGSFLSAEDANTVVFDAIPSSIAYIPIPALQMTAGVGTTPTTKQTYAGLLTIDLPASVARDAKLNVLVRRITTQSKVIIPPPPVPQIQRATSATAGNTITWRVVSGAFQVTIPVVGNIELLAGAANTLAILKARLGAMSTQYRWYLVVQRLIGIVSGQVSGSGGNPSQIPPSWNGWPPKKHCGCGDGDDCHHHEGHHHKHGDHDHGHGKEP